MPGMILRSHGSPEYRPAPVQYNRSHLVETLSGSTSDVPASTMVPTVIMIILLLVIIQLLFVKA